jgi:hypothetical protein
MTITSASAVNGQSPNLIPTPVISLFQQQMQLQKIQTKTLKREQ